MTQPDNKQLRFNARDYKRLRDACRALGTSMAEFIEFATLTALDEMEGYARDAEVLRRFYGGGVQ